MFICESFSEGPFDFEIMRVDCIFSHLIYLNSTTSPPSFGIYCLLCSVLPGLIISELEPRTSHVLSVAANIQGGIECPSDWKLGNV